MAEAAALRLTGTRAASDIVGCSSFCSSGCHGQAKNRGASFRHSRVASRSAAAKQASRSLSLISHGFMGRPVNGSQHAELSGSRLSGVYDHSHHSKRGRGLITMVIPFQRGNASQQPPPDLPSYLFKSRIVFLGMSLVPAVTELLMAELLYLQYEDAEKPIYMYINSTGVTKDGEKLGYETEAFAIYDTMGYVKPPIFTLAIGNAWGEAAMLLAAGATGNRAALPSATIMIKQPIGMFRGQATDIDIAAADIRRVKDDLIELYARHTGHSKEKIEEDIERPKYMSPEAAVEYNIIDKVLHQEKGKRQSVVDALKSQGVLRG